MANNGSAFDILKAIALRGFNSEFPDEGVTYANQIVGNISSISNILKCLN